MQDRKCLILVGDDAYLTHQLQQASAHLAPESLLLLQNAHCENSLFPLGQIVPFEKSKNLLGQEFPYLLFDARHQLHLESLAIASGTLKAGGVLVILLNHWQNYAEQPDLDSLRWADGQCIASPLFRLFFQEQIHHFAFPVLQQKYQDNLSPFSLLPEKKKENLTLTLEQEDLYQKLLAQQPSHVLITAKRGRGKSAFAGFLAQHFLAQGKTIILTAPNKQAVQTLMLFCAKPLTFMAPDALLLALEKGSCKADLLFIDEAAMLPLPLLQRLSRFFPKLVCTTTVESYEGTGRGFALKFMQENALPWQHFRLQTPLRWKEHDPLEKWVESLLGFQPLKLEKQKKEKLTYQLYSQQTLWQKNRLLPFYQLLSQAHYRTAPTDLRRLFDGENQHFFLAEKEQLIGGIWALTEGHLQEENLLTGILQGERRPRGHLVAQLLAQSAQDLRPCQFSSWRISRIAIEKNLQNQQIGQQLMQNFIHLAQSQKNLDFLSVSFGYNEKLAHFWQKCGFTLVFLAETQTASSGCYSAVFLYPLSQRGKTLCAFLRQTFKQNLAFYQHSLLETVPSLQKLAQDNACFLLKPNDVASLHNFAFAHLRFYFALPALKRLLQEKNTLENCPLLKDYFTEKQWVNQPSSRQWQKKLRDEIAQFLKQKPQ